MEHLNGVCGQCGPTAFQSWGGKHGSQSWWVVNRPLPCWKAKQGGTNSQSGCSGTSHACLTVHNSDPKRIIDTQ